MGDDGRHEEDRSEPDTLECTQVGLTLFWLNCHNEVDLFNRTDVFDTSCAE